MIKVPVKFVIVEWDDAWKSATDDTTIEAAHENHKPIRCYAAGWLVRDTPDAVQLGSEYSPEDRKFRHLQLIPRGMIKSILPYRLSREKAVVPRVAPPEPTPPLV
jgi:hypothetical protein